MSTTLKFDGIYEGPARGFGCWFHSKEKLPIGTVRQIRGILFHVYMVNGGLASWVPCDDDKNKPENWREFQSQVVEGNSRVVLK